MEKTKLTAILYAAMQPISVWAGIEFGSGNYIFGSLLVVVLAYMDYCGVMLWMKAQTEEINKNTPPVEAL